MTEPTAADTLLAALRQQSEQTGRLRLERSGIWAAFLAALPAAAGSAEARPRLVGLLHELDLAGELTLPRGPKGFDWTATPPFPEWITLRRPPRPAAEGKTLHDPRRVPWAPELAFAASMGRLGEDTWRELQQCQRFFVEGGRYRPLVPLRERSVRIFGDELHLERLLRSPLFALGRLTPEALRCFPVAPPLVWEPGPQPGRPLLVVEGHHAFYSFGHWNRQRGAYSAVILGGGNGFPAAVEFLAEIGERAQAAEEVRYFGDLDADGLKIPLKADEQARRHQLPPILPATRWYQLLLERGEQSPFLFPAATATTPDPRLLQWLPAELHAPVAALLQAGRRLPHDLLGWEGLVAAEPVES